MSDKSTPCLGAVGLSLVALAWLVGCNKPGHEIIRPRPDAEEPAPLPVRPKEFTNSIGMKMVLIPAGECQMGSNGGRDTETPVHTVTIAEPFYMAATEVTEAQWRAVMGASTSQFKGDDSSPVKEVSWHGAVDFCKRLTEEEQVTYRLPTEAESRYVCRCGSATKCSIDNDGSRADLRAWYVGSGENMGVLCPCYFRYAFGGSSVPVIRVTARFRVVSPLALGSEQAKE